MDSRVIPTVEYDAPDVPPEVRLFQAVVLNAWQDAFLRSDIDLRNSEGKGSDPVLTRQESRRWLTSDIEPWASSRQTVADYANLDSTWLQGLARKRLALEKETDVEREAESQRKAKARIDEMFARLLAQSDSLHPGRVNQYLNRLAKLESETV